MTAYRYLRSCVDWPESDVHCPGGLRDMIEGATDITRQTFLSRVDRTDLRHLEAMLGYDDHPARGLTMAGDWHVSYHRSRLRGRRVYFFKHSAIEYVFIAV